jgi:hypothetical protein
VTPKSVQPGGPLPKGLYWRGGVIWVRCIDGATDKRVSSFGTSVQDAEDLLARLRTERVAGKIDKALERNTLTPMVRETPARSKRVQPGDPLPKGLFWRSGVIWVRCLDGTTDKRVSSFGTSVAAAEALLARLRVERTAGKLDKSLGRKSLTPTVRELVER